MPNHDNTVNLLNEQEMCPSKAKQYSLRTGSRSRKVLRLHQMSDFDARRFWNMVDIRSDEECWPWTGRLKRGGYGTFGWDYHHGSPHRIAFMLHHGGDPYPALILHSCHRRDCVNPHHMRLGSHADNSADMVAAERSASGMKQGLAKLTDEQHIAIHKRVRKYGKTDNTVTLAKEFGVSHYVIGTIMNGTRKGGLAAQEYMKSIAAKRQE